MFLRVQVLSSILGILLIIIVVNFIRKRKLHEDYSLLWLTVSLSALILSVFSVILFKLANILGAIYPASVVFFISIIFIIILNLHFSVKITKLDKENKDLCQELALLRLKVEMLTKDNT